MDKGLDEKRGMTKPFSFVIKNFREVSEEFIYSEEFCSYIFSWRLKVYPRGDVEGKKEGFISVFIESMDDTPKGLTDNRTVTINLSVSGDTERGIRRITKTYGGGKGEVHGWSFCKALSLLSSFSDLTVEVIVAEEDVPGWNRRKGIWPNGVQYIGWTKNMFRDGYGVLTFPSFGKSIGAFKDDKKHGLMVDMLYNGERFEGTYVNDKRQGFGVYVFANGNRYEGEFSNDEISGYGELQYANGDYYKGRWVLGKRNGYGTLLFKDGSKYVGEWVNDRRSGRGTYFDLTGKALEGEWEDDALKGHNQTLGGAQHTPVPGVASSSSSTSSMPLTSSGPSSSTPFSGTRKSSLTIPLPHGPKFTYPDGSVFVGPFNEEKQKHGKGVFVFTNGDRYEGDWVNDKRHGIGKIVYAKGGYFDGSWLDDQEREGKGVIWHGEGRVMLETNDIFEGSFKEGMREGYGICYYANGDEYEGEWHHDKRDGRGTCRYGNMLNYQGCWKNDKKHGCGIEWHRSPENPDRRLGFYEGVWKNGNRNGCGVFTWPESRQSTSSPLRYLREYDSGSLVSEVPLDENDYLSPGYEKYRPVPPAEFSPSSYTSPAPLISIPTSQSYQSSNVVGDDIDENDDDGDDIM